MGLVESFFANTFGGNPAIATLFVAFLPVVELRGAIPFGTSEKLFGSQALGIWQSFLISVLACLLIASVLLLLLKPVFWWLGRVKGIGRIIRSLEDRFAQKAEKVKCKSSSCNKQLFFVFLFASIPVPLTGVWTGSALAVFLGLPYLRSLGVLGAGTIVSGLLIVGLTLLCGDYAGYIFNAFILLAVIIVGFLVIRSVFRRTQVQG